MGVGRAAEEMGMRVLQGTLISSEPSSFPDREGDIGSGSFWVDDTPVSTPGQEKTQTQTHVRSKSRSQLYAAGQFERELELSNSRNGNGSPGAGGGVPEGTRVWTGREIEMQCVQNSSIPLVLSYLQVWAPE